MSDWRNLNDATDQKAAPWDGKPVLICTNHSWGGRVHRAYWTDAVHGTGIFGWAVTDCKFGPYALRGYTLVTHWMPLPEPPALPDDPGSGKTRLADEGEATKTPTSTT